MRNFNRNFIFIDENRLLFFIDANYIRILDTPKNIYRYTKAYWAIFQMMSR